MSDSEPVDWKLMRADSRARQGFFKALQAESEAAFRRGHELPVIPLNEELTFIDGFLVWKGRPVWYSGEGCGRVAGMMDGPGFMQTPMFARPDPEPRPAPAPYGLRRWLRLRWRALAYGHAG